VPVKDEAGHVQGLVYSMADVTDRKRSEQEREQHLASLNTLIMVSKRLLAEKTLDGLFNQIVEAAHELTGVNLSTNGYSYEDGVFKLDADILNSEDEVLLAQLSALASLGLRHIEARTEAEKRADELDAVFSAIIDVITVYDSTGSALRVNPAAVDVYGLDPAGLDAKDFLTPMAIRRTDGQPVNLNELPSRRALRGEIVRDERLVVSSASGETLTVLASSSPLYVEWKDHGCCFCLARCDQN
jgi:PAS domain-containing protein